MQLQSQVGDFIVRQLSTISPVPISFQWLIECACIRLFDAAMIVEDPLSELAPLKEPRIEQPLKQIEQIYAIDRVIDAVRSEGLIKYFHEMIGLFGSVMISLTATEKQHAQVKNWVDRGISGHFLMTDSGGPSLNSWRTEQIENERGLVLNVDKIHGIGAQNLGFAMVVAKQSTRPFPATFLLPPDICAQLNQSAIGKPFLAGALQLGNCHGSVRVSRDMLLSKGGLGSVNQFLSLIRPRFVKSLMHYILWLHDQNEVDLTTLDQEHIEYLIYLCNEQISTPVFSLCSIDRVLAIKFSSNELLLDLVCAGKVKSKVCQRDFLAFTKAEGSSYRCFYEIYSKAKEYRI